MAITDADKVDFLWKKVIFGTSTTADGTLKAGSNETVSSPLAVYADQIWTQTSTTDIPASPPGASTATVQLLLGANRVRMTADPTAPANVTWLATSTFNTVSSKMGDFVPPTFGASYSVEVFIGDPNVGPAAKLFPDTAGEEWVFDYAAGVLHFPSGVPASKTATIGSGTVTVAASGIYLRGYRYVGAKGVSAAGTSSRNWVVADINARDALTPSTGDTVFVQDASGIGSDAGAGEYAIYLWTGSAWSLVATEDSARTDALTSSVTATTPISNPYSLGRVGNRARVVSVLVEVLVAFDQETDLIVGDSGDTDRLVSADETDLSATGTFLIYPNHVYQDGTETAVNVLLSAVNAGTPPTMGEARVTITYA